MNIIFVFNHHAGQLSLASSTWVHGHCTFDLLTPKADLLAVATPTTGEEMMRAATKEALSL